ncbi:MAG: T9SS type A sorting domain-containing protein, partial [candidate division WOR-3 bacterium]
PQRVYVGTSNGVFRSTDAGATWSATSLTQQTRSLAIDPNHPESIFAGTYGQGVYASTNAGTTWTPMNEGLTNPRILSMSLRPGIENTIFVGTEGGSVFRTSLPTALSGPSCFVLRPSDLTITPNPLRGGIVTLRLNKQATHWPVMVSIIDVSGRCVLRSSFGTRTSSLPLNLRGLSAGVYTVRLTAGGYSVSQKLLLQH